MGETKRGGKRKGAGRKRLSDKKQQIQFSLRESEIEKLGGKYEVKRKVLNMIKSGWL
ncbi:MAG: hypothetical protein ACOC2U_00785 [bacterium]